MQHGCHVLQTAFLLTNYRWYISCRNVVHLISLIFFCNTENDPQYSTLNLTFLMAVQAKTVSAQS